MVVLGTHLLDENARSLLSVAVAVRLHPRDEGAARAELHHDVDELDKEKNGG